MKGPQPFHLSSAGPALPVRGAAESRFLYQFAAVKWHFQAELPGNAILQQMDVSIERLLADFRWQSIDFVDALSRAANEWPPGIFDYDPTFM